MTNFKTGDNGQRYEIHGVLHDGTDEVFGWQDVPDGGLFDCAKLWPRYKSAYVIDRKNINLDEIATEICKIAIGDGVGALNHVEKVKQYLKNKL